MVDAVDHALHALPRLMGEPEAAARLDVCTATLVRWRKRGLIGFIQHGRHVRYTDQHLLDYLAQQEVKPCHDPQKATAGRSVSSGSVEDTTARLGAERGSITEHARLLAHRSALTILKPPRSDSRNGSH
jgi:Helix-turn-helix domain